MSRALTIIGVETIRLDEFPNLLWVQVHTDAGIVGLGETYFAARAVEAWIHEAGAARIIDADAREVERLNAVLMPYIGFSGTGVETRARSAIDVALYDAVGKHLGEPVSTLLGGRSRERIRTYNTCAGYRYVRAKPDWQANDWGLDAANEGPYEDLDAFLNRPAELAQSLLDEGTRAMKIWPFDFTESAKTPHDISPADLDAGVAPFAKIREAVGNQMDLMVELHSIWRLPAALRIAEALEPYNPFWYEDPVRMDSLPALTQFAASTRVPVCASETVGSHHDHRALLDTGAVGIVMPDIVWCGGLTTARKIAALADTYHLPLAPHDCTGPIAFAAAVQFSMSAPNLLLQESVRAFRTGWYRELVTEVPDVVDGHILPLDGPGLGTELAPGLKERADAHCQLTGSRC